ncbi:DeoR/GlpR family DNA-binding transcription regulator [Streptococcus downei]|uniref:Lactose phosphotransferase system repressor n=1 Tax=Streptococcus downei MFe28 TaxID=764290 RepID=A0A380JDS5_STRDO|nr:DeoR/GlpR family DNA-binding transcription regulator [Streptococcus downei]EFQ56828.1 transcriptional regulator, DeoR family [Streptococcus downei F0415]SUN36122.1 lactose phosphotransferase system repressor [Streptococcus downei MFe28]
MIKKERLNWILDQLSQQSIIRVTDIMEALQVSDMTVRRDLAQLEKEHRLIRIHGGAQSLSPINRQEKTNLEKQSQQVAEKRQIAAYTAKRIQDGETIFIGPGTTLEFLAQELVERKLRIITNSLPIFEILQESPSVDLLLIGGEYRPVTGAFVGSLASNNIDSLVFSKAFIGANAIYKDAVATYNESEGTIQELALNKAIEKYLLVDHKKFNAYDFFIFYKTSDFNYVITDSKLSDDIKAQYETLTHVLRADEE